MVLKGSGFRLAVDLTCLGFFLHCWGDYFSLVLCVCVSSGICYPTAIILDHGSGGLFVHDLILPQTGIADPSRALISSSPELQSARKKKQKEKTKEKNILSGPRPGSLLHPPASSDADSNSASASLSLPPVAGALRGVFSGVEGAAAPRTLRCGEGDLYQSSGSRPSRWCPPIYVWVGRVVICRKFDQTFCSALSVAFGGSNRSAPLFPSPQGELVDWSGATGVVSS